jgi:sugar lactone lactonase YvrE
MRARQLGGFRLAVMAGIAAVVATAAVAAALALGSTTSSEVAASRFATDFPNKDGIGPIGLAFDGANRLYVIARGNLYRFGSDGGTAAAHRVSSRPIAGFPAGLAFDGSGHLYLARWTNGRTGDVVQLDPGTGAVVRQVASNIACPTGLAVDPLSGDLFVSEVYCRDQVLRISNGRASTAVSGVSADGLVFAPDGTLYIAHAPDANGYTVSVVPRGGGARTGLARVDDADGIALGQPQDAAGQTPFLVANSRNGTITRIDLADSSHPTRTLMRGGTRGDFTAVGGDGCLYATQTDEVLKVTNSDGSCRREATPGNTNSGLGTGLVPTSTAPVQSSASGGSVRPRPKSSCRGSRKLKVRYRVHHVRGKARIYIGKRLARRVSGRALRRGVTVKRLPRSRFTLTIRGKTPHGRKLTVRRRYKACAGKRA